MSDREPRLRNHGDQVQRLQALLNQHGAKLAEDGAFGPMTDRALRSYQRRHDLFPADGISGLRTMASLDGERRIMTTLRWLPRRPLRGHLRHEVVLDVRPRSVSHVVSRPDRHPARRDAFADNPGGG